eukprot:8991837-Lingulodinium_polyedra.AAC.1
MAAVPDQAQGLVLLASAEPGGTALLNTTSGEVKTLPGRQKLLYATSGFGFLVLSGGGAKKWVKDVLNIKICKK